MLSFYTDLNISNLYTHLKAIVTEERKNTFHGCDQKCIVGFG